MVEFAEKMETQEIRDWASKVSEMQTLQIQKRIFLRK